MKRDFDKVIRLGMYGLVLIGAACSQTGVNSSAQDMAVSHELSQHSDGNSTVRPVDGGSMDQQISAAVTDLAARTHIDADTIKITQARAVSWGSSALGCPKPGMNYTQAIVPGILLFLEAGGTIYRYHGRTGSNLFYCPNERAVAPAYGPGQEIM